MGATNNFHRICSVVPDFQVVVVPAKASTAFSPGDLVCWDSSNSWIEPVSTGTSGVSNTVANIGANFLGVCLDGKLSSDTTLGRPGSNGLAGALGNLAGLKVAQVCLYKANVASGTFKHGDTVVGVTGSTGDYTVAAGSTSGSVIGTVYGNYATATTKVRVRLLGVKSDAVYADRN